MDMKKDMQGAIEEGLEQEIEKGSVPKESMMTMEDVRAKMSEMMTTMQEIMTAIETMK